MLRTGCYGANRVSPKTLFQLCQIERPRGYKSPKRLGHAQLADSVLQTDPNSTAALVNDPNHIVLAMRSLGVHPDVILPNTLVVHKTVPPQGKRGTLAMRNGIAVVEPKRRRWRLAEQIIEQVPVPPTLMPFARQVIFLRIAVEKYAAANRPVPDERVASVPHSTAGPRCARP